MSADLLDEALARLAAAIERARAAGMVQPEAMALATADAEGRPSVRVVLAKGVGRDGIRFFTNLGSPKARHLAARPWAEACFYWDPLWEQARVAGRVERVSEAEADAYWASRPRARQLGAWASRQSEPLPDRATLEARLEAMAARFGEGPVPRPPFWSGLRIVPERIEFWRGDPARLNERECYRLEGGGWRRLLLYP
ncbi:pyridoxamine 5'-phosphate oxidase [Inmirania thermothiophila]|uniref:Pyridoxamine 5'-phosphate oxidase n=1 Tax=Inmirania thermothiophila TaxID=1750597 RepID=A0A3N1Y960_9GAMM|nr:pyridoxamine 5'-phosphate oxidase [Inmirania thermothiophila]ROR34142.1 pyridoxamine 5'-phosphate oxidase [Inmirania thermothiophila]